MRPRFIPQKARYRDHPVGIAIVRLSLAGVLSSAATPLPGGGVVDRCDSIAGFATALAARASFPTCAFVATMASTHPIGGNSAPEILRFSCEINDARKSWTQITSRASP
jgi:hypothetical protein